MNTGEIQMLDPLSGFNWADLHSGYDRLCKRFDPSSPYLGVFACRIRSERSLYYALVDRLRQELNTGDGITVDSYTSMLYWKLYSQPAAIANTCKPLVEKLDLQKSTALALRHLSSQLLTMGERISGDICATVRMLNDFAIWGMKSSTALPVRTTLLHFLYPAAVPIFDKQVLLAVGITQSKANEKIEYLKRYIPHANALAAKHAEGFTRFGTETPIRKIDMALWVIRGGCQ